MKPNPPPYIPVQVISKPEIRHGWNDWDPFEPLGTPKKETKAILEQVSNTGITLFATGCAEWVVYRLSRFFDDDTPYEYLEAFWVFLMGRAEALPPETDHEDWLGPVRGPVNLSLMTILNTVYLSENGPPIQNGALAAEIALFVLTEKPLFLAWQQAVLKRLLIYCPRNPNDPNGPPVPREVLDPSVEINSQNAPMLIQATLNSADYQSNPFLKDVKPPPAKN